MSEHVSVWLAGDDRPTYPPLDGDLDVDVAVVGGGITGLTTALVLQRQGMQVALVEADRVGSGTTGNTTGKVTSQHGLAYQQLVARHGRHKARLYADANQAAIETMASLAGEADADCRFVRAPAFVYALTPEQRDAVEAEHAAARSLGLPAALTTDVDLPFPVEVALRFDGQAHVHAGRYAGALARAIAAGGGRVRERTRATAVDEVGVRVVVRTTGGEVRADHAVIATLLPIVDTGGFFARARPSRSYGVAARLRQPPPAGMHLGVESPSRSTRPWIEGDQPGLVVVGESHATGEGEPTPARWGELERWAREHFEVESFEHRWSAQDYITADGVPFVGRSPRRERTYVATGFGKWGLTNGTAAAAILADLVQGRTNPWHAAFDATRIGGPRTLGRVVADNLHVARRFAADRLGRAQAGPAADLGPGEGGVATVGGRTGGAYRDAGGTLHAVSITCTHMGCTLRWNQAETSWDCPCHGSRFSHDGAVLNAPAVRPLDRIEGGEG
jgi:glycine/D-amino acid oxidase-like deaminating enzyme/nitrite reductase/ring-hydroxylating ferredoxin subunit